MAIETIRLAHMPTDLLVYATLYENVSNTIFLKDQLLAGNTAFEYAFIDAATVVSRKHVLAAAFRAMNDYLHNRMKSRNVHSEIVFALNPNSNIGDAFRRFGIGDSTRNLVVLKVATSSEITAEAVSSHLRDKIQGENVPFEDDRIRNLGDLSRIRKNYKLASAADAKKVPNRDTDSLADEWRDLEVQILGLMALRGAT